MARFKKAQDIKVGTVGYGGRWNMGGQHLGQMQAAGMTPVAVAELDESRLEQAAAEWDGIETYNSVETMLAESDVDLVALITPHNTHAPIALQCLGAGCNVITEKPFAVTTGECDQMIALAKENDLLLSTYHNRHWDGCVVKALDVIGSGAIGEVYRVEAHNGGYRQPGETWRSSKTISGGILYDWGVHFLEYSLQIIDAEIVEVSGFAHNGYWGDKVHWGSDMNEDEARAVVRFEGGKWLELTLSSLDSNPKPGWLEITGTEGSYIFDGPTWELITRDDEGNTVITKGQNPPNEHVRFYENIVDHLVNDAPLVITPEWARRPIHILDLADRSAKAGRTLEATYK